MDTTLFILGDAVAMAELAPVLIGSAIVIFVWQLLDWIWDITCNWLDSVTNNCNTRLSGIAM